MQQLESLMGYEPLAPREVQQVYFTVGDLESLSVNALYSGDKIIIQNGKIIIPLDGLHDTYDIDSEGNLSNGHSTVNLPGSGKVYMPHGYGKPSIKSGS